MSNFSSASHVVILLAKKYPNYKIVNMDCLDYCASLKNLDEVKDLPNYRFVEVREEEKHNRKGKYPQLQFC